MQKTPQGGVATPPAPPATPVPGAANPASLQAQLNELYIQRASLQAQHNALRKQLSSMRDDSPARPQVQVKDAEVGVQQAQVEGDIARIEAQLGRRSVPGGTTQQPGPAQQHRQFDPDLAAGLMFAFIFAVMMPVSIAYARRIWRGKPAPPADPSLAPRFDRLEQAVDAIAIEIERVSEGQRFVTKILAERPTAAANGTDQSAPRALGAGAAEPIQVGQREGVGAKKL